MDGFKKEATEYEIYLNEKMSIGIEIGISNN